MTERRYKLLNGFTLVVSEECLGVQLDTGMTITTDGDEIIDDVLALLNQTKSERDKAIRDLSDYKSKRGENLGEMLDARAEADRLRLELEAAREAYRNLRTPRSIDEWDEDYGDVLWWDFPLSEPPYYGTPLDSDWPDYHTHWTRIVDPILNQEVERNQDA